MSLQILIYVLVLLGTAPLVQAQELTVAAAANLQSVLEEITAVFESTYPVKVNTILGSSGKLTAQIENGAPFDLFLAADMQHPQYLYERHAASQPPAVYARGSLVLWTNKELDLSAGLDVLRSPLVKKISLPDPKVSPYGTAAVQALDYYRLYPDIQTKLVYGESISQANDFVLSQSADIGFTSKSTMLSPILKKKIPWVEIPSTSYSPLLQGALILKHGEKHHPAEARQFYDFLFSHEAKSLFLKYGYGIHE